MSRALVLPGGVLALMLAGVAAAAPLTLTPLAARTSDAVILRDHARLDSLRTRLAAADAEHDWRLARAQALLVAASAEYVADDRTGFAEAAFAESRALADGASRPAAPGASAPLAGTRVVHEALWSDLRGLAAGEGADCAAVALARAEVELLWAGNLSLDQGDCGAAPHVAAAERWLGVARDEAERCRRPAPTPVAATPAPVPPAPATPAPMPGAEELRIPRNVHFGLDRADLSARSDSVIAGVAAVLLRYPDITVRLEGHTDSRASAAYNLRLSERRVRSVEARLIALGVAPARVTATWKGKAALRATEDSSAGFARNRRVEMVFVDPSGRDLATEEQEGDLQLEGR